MYEKNRDRGGVESMSSSVKKINSTLVSAVTPVSAVMITKNEEKKISSCLYSLSWAQEIIVIDANSQDKTSQICQDQSKPWAKKIRFINRSWSGFRDQRNFALKQAQQDWVLVIDADEECSIELQKKICSLFEHGNIPPSKAYKVRRVEYFLGKEIRYGIWNPSYQDRFFHRVGIEYKNDIHEYPLFRCRPEKLHEPLLHSPDFSPEKFLYKMNHYTTLEAQARVAAGQRTRVFTLFFAFPAMFFKNYFYYKAYKDGMYGFIISLLEGISRAVRHIKIWQFSNSHRSQNIEKSYSRVEK
jgi:glycosyltransferase involved in cell wall biosynthesis